MVLSSFLVVPFGHYITLIFEFAHEVNPEKIWALDLLSESTQNIKSKVEIKGNKITIPGKLIDTIGAEAGAEGDMSVPDLVLKLENK